MAVTRRRATKVDSPVDRIEDWPPYWPGAPVKVKGTSGAGYVFLSFTKHKVSGAVAIEVISDKKSGGVRSFDPARVSLDTGKRMRQAVSSVLETGWCRPGPVPTALAQRLEKERRRRARSAQKVSA